MTNGFQMGAASRGPQASALARMKMLALLLLVLAAALYGIAIYLQPRHAAWSYVAAFAEAAMVGAVADWFAVTALFRHPLGLPIPHTAIIPTNQARIGDRLATFICSNFLANEQVLGKLRSFDFARQLAGWLKAPAHAALVGEHLATAFRHAIGALDDDRVRAFVQRNAVIGLQKVDVSKLLGQMLDALTSNRRHQELLDQILVQVSHLLENESVRARVGELIASEVRILRYVGLDTVAGKLVTDRIVAGVSRVIGEMGEDPQHPMRLRFDVQMDSFIARLKSDPAFKEKGDSLKAELLAHPAVTGYVHGLWSELLAWLQADLDRPDSSIRKRVSFLALKLGEKLAADQPMQDWINAQLMEAAPRWIDRYREDIRQYIVTRVNEWNTDDMTAEVERHVGRDLQFVRINGTLVGGSVGLLIHAVTQWLG